MTIDEAGARLRSGQVSCAELTEEALRQAEALNPTLNAFITITAAQAREHARRLDGELRSGEDRGPLHGIPIAHKDLIFTKGVRTTCGSLLFKDFVPDHDAVVVERLEAAGAVSIGKLGLHELAYGITSNNPHFGPVRNPRNTAHIPGGSSGGSGAAVAAGIVYMATGTDTGGSIRAPAAYCGTVGFKPTYGLVSRCGVQPLAASLDHVGPLTRSAADARIVLNAMTAHPERATETPASMLRVGLPQNFYFDGIDPEVRAAVERAARACEEIGARVEPVRVPDVEALNVAGIAILLSEAASVYRHRLNNREMFGRDVLALLEQGCLLAATDYITSQRLRKQMQSDWKRLFDSIDVLLTPAIPITAPKIGQQTVQIGGVEADTRMLTTRFIRGVNVLGLPALAMPCGVSAEGLPIGLQLVGRAFEDAVVLGFGAALERALGAA